MASIAALLAEATERLSASGSDSPRLDSEVLLAHACGVSRTYFYAWPEREPTDETSARFQDLLNRRVEGHPVAYLTGSKEFWSRGFRVTPAVLIPRPETEFLVELSLEKLKDLAKPRILDLGTGSGAIAITLAAELPGAELIAVDISLAALAVAHDNFAQHRIHNLQLICGNWCDGLSQDTRFDLIVSNPPYIPDGDEHLSTGDVRFEPLPALASGNDGLDSIRVIAATSRHHLALGGCLLLEHGWNQGESVRSILIEQGFDTVETRPDFQGHERLSFGTWPGDGRS